MAVVALIQRVLGMSAICLVAVMAPLPPTQRIAVLTAFGIGLAVAAVLPGYDRLAARVMGPSVVIMALAPVAGVWALLQLVACAGAGVAGFNRSGMSRLVPALGLPLAMLLARTGTGVSAMIVAVWAALVVGVILLGGRVGFMEMGPRLSPSGGGGERGPGFSGRRSATAVVALLLIVPLAVVAAGPVVELWSGRTGDPGVGAADGAGPGVAGHPGFNGGLDAGAPVVLDEGVVLRVRADRPLYWRGAVYDQWDGRRWSASNDLATAVATDTGTIITAGSGPSAQVVEQRFTLVGSSLDVPVGAWRPRTVAVPGRTATIGADGSMAVSAPLSEGATWLVSSDVRAVTADDLRAADPARLEPDDPLVLVYATEDDVVPQVAALAEAITADAPTTYDKVRAIESWMDEHLVYTRDIPRLSPGSDAVSELLLHARRGFCEQIGSALVVMLRSLGIPARLVVGYVPGSYDGATGEWVSRGTDAHAWAEVYFPGVGWQGFDPTAGVPLAGERAELTSIGGGESPARIARSGAVAAAVGVAVLAVVAVARRRGRRPAEGADRRLRRSPRGRQRGSAGRRQRARESSTAALVARFDRAGQRLGCPTTKVMTLREQGAVMAAAGIDPVVVDRTVRLLERLVYRPDGDGALLLEVEAALGQLEWCIDVYQLAVPVDARA
ncbi:MAG: transglutaminaseTgpA domain-containing protein [Actinomycetota bacterium]